MTENFFRNFFIIIKIACGTGFLIMIQYYKIEKTLIKAMEHVFHIRNSSSEKIRRTRAVMAPPSGQLGHFILGTKRQLLCNISSSYQLKGIKIHIGNAKQIWLSFV